MANHTFDLADSDSAATTTRTARTPRANHSSESRFPVAPAAGVPAAAKAHTPPSPDRRPLPPNRAAQAPQPAPPAAPPPAGAGAAVVAPEVVAGVVVASEVKRRTGHHRPNQHHNGQHPSQGQAARSRGHTAPDAAQAPAQGRATNTSRNRPARPQPDYRHAEPNGPFDQPYGGPFDQPYDGPFDQPYGDGPFDQPYGGPFDPDGPFDPPPARGRRL